ncbi:hypothetical protein [Methylobacterium gossipiicola]|uniref:Uncharacterized protein n=1 Tax=Methylobacterium gossipiicola TaxID=582675 RepID=A0A1I2TR21_9HYPH|nr:hypothetical protein [Methylobacterium gossipiicola]SFG64916.1 hypothetical protein SAMN05192565_107146 [Methylobacterium gossipiicola]
MSGGSKTTTTTQNSKTDPYAAAVPSLQKIVDAGNKAFDSGVGSQVYGGQRVAGLGDTTRAGLDAMKANAGATTGTASAGNGFLGDLLAGGGSTSGTRGATAALSGVDPTVNTSGVSSAAARLADPNSVARTTGAALAGGAYGTDTAALTTLADGLATGPSQTRTSLQDVADGKFLGGANPFLDDIINRSSNEAASQVGQKFAASGRYGSGRFAAATADAVANVGTQARYADYEAERARQANAATAIDSAENARAGTVGGLYQGIAGINSGNGGLAATGANLSLNADGSALTGANALASLEGSNADRSLARAGALLSGAQSDRAAGLSGLGQVSTVQNDLLTPGRTLASVGAAEDEARQQELASAQDVFNEQQSAPWRQAGLLSELALPVAASGNTTTGTTTQKVPQASLLQQLLGGGLAIAGTASKFYKPV